MKHLVFILVLFAQLQTFAHFSKNGKRLGWHSHTDKVDKTTVVDSKGQSDCKTTTDSNFKDITCSSLPFEGEIKTQCHGIKIDQFLCINKYNCHFPGAGLSNSIHITKGNPLQCYHQCFDSKTKRAEYDYENKKISYFELTHLKYKEGKVDFIELYDAINNDFQDKHKKLIEEISSLPSRNPSGAKINELQVEKFAHLFALNLEPEVVDKIVAGYTLVGEAGEENAQEQAAVYAVIKNRAAPLPGYSINTSDGPICKSHPTKWHKLEAEKSNTQLVPNSCDKKHKAYRDIKHDTRDIDTFERITSIGNEAENKALNNILTSIEDRNALFYKEESQKDTSYNIAFAALKTRQFSFWNYDNFKNGKRVKDSTDGKNIKRALFSGAGTSHTKRRAREKIKKAFEVIDNVENGSISVTFNGKPYQQYSSVTHYATPETEKSWTNRKVNAKACAPENGKKVCRTIKEHTFYKLRI